MHRTRCSICLIIKNPDVRDENTKGTLKSLMWQRKKKENGHTPVFTLQRKSKLFATIFALKMFKTSCSKIIIHLNTKYYLKSTPVLYTVAKVSIITVMSALYFNQ